MSVKLSDIVELDRALRNVQNELSELLVVERREVEVFSRLPAVNHLAELFSRGHADKIEPILDRLFEDLRDHESFEHQELVMAILVAAKIAKIQTTGILGVLGTSRAASISGLTRVARTMLREDRKQKTIRRLHRVMSATLLEFGDLWDNRHLVADRLFAAKSRSIFRERIRNKLVIIRALRNEIKRLT